MKAIRGLVGMAVVALVVTAPLGARAAFAGDIVIKRDPSKAVYVPPAPPPPASPDTAGGFQLDDAGVGAAGMLVLVCGVAGVMSLRGRRHFGASQGGELNSP